MKKKNSERKSHKETDNQKVLKEISERRLHKAYKKAHSPEVAKAISNYYSKHNQEYAREKAKELLEGKKIKLKKININKPMIYKSSNPLKSLLKRKKTQRVYVKSQPSEPINLMRWRW